MRLGTRRKAGPMSAHSRRHSRPAGMTNRRAECGALDRLVDAVRAGESRALVVRGDPGVGKTVLLDYLAGRASGSGCRVERAVGVQSEMELAFAGLHQLCAPMLSGAGPGRGGRGGAGAFGRAGAGARRAGRGRGVPGALGVADRRSGPACRTQPGRGAGLPAGRSVRQRSGPARGGGGRASRRARQRPGGPAARPHCVRLGPGQRCTPAAAEGGQAARAAQPGHCPRHLLDRVDSGDVRRAPSWRRLPDRGVRCGL